MKPLYNYLATGSAAILFFFIALIDLLMNEDKNDPNAWAKSWEYMTWFGKASALICVALILWTIGVRLIGRRR